MLTKTLEVLRQKDNRQFFESNEGSFNEFLAEHISSYEEFRSNLDHFNTMFKTMDGLFYNNSKLFSNLKHMCYDLGNLLTKSGALIHSITATYNKVISDTHAVYDKLKIKVDQEVSDITKKLKIGLNEWGSQLKVQSTYVVDHLASFFHFKKHENLSFSSLLQAKMGMHSNFVKSWSSLDAQKKKLFDSKNTEKWKINFEEVDEDINEVMKDFKKARPFMLPDVN